MNGASGIVHSANMADDDDEHVFNVAVDQARALLSALARRRRVVAVSISRRFSYEWPRPDAGATFVAL